MSFSRRKLLRQISVGAVVGVAAPALRGFSSASAAEMPRGSFVAGDEPVRVATAADPILLYRNENPYGASEKVLAVLREAVASSNRYPRTEYETLIGKVAATHKVKPEQIVLGCGSGEILGMAALAFLKPG